MDLPALENASKTLQHSLDSLATWLSIWTLLVVVGLIVEYAKEVFDIITIRPFHWPALWILIGGILITGGVAGELYIQFNASRIETALRTNNIQVEALLNIEAANARAAAGEAAVRAGNANERATKTEMKLAKTALRAAEATARAAEASSKAELERLARTRLEAQIAPRRLSAEQQTFVSDTLRRFSGRSVTLTSYSLDVEAAVLGRQLKAALESAGIRVNDNLAGTLPIGRFATGIHVSGPLLERDFVQALETALGHNGNIGSVSIDPPISSFGSVGLLVGIKPID